MLRNHGTGLRFHSHREDLLSLRLLDVAGDAADGAAGSHAADQHIDLARRVVPDLRAGGSEMDVGIGRVLELLQQQVTLRVGVVDLFGLRDSALHPQCALGQNQVRAESLEHLAALDRHRLRHGQRKPVAARRGDEGERDAGVAAGRLDQFDAGLEQTPLLGVPDHGRTDAALYRIGRIPSLDLGEDGGARAFHDTIQLDQRRPADAQ